MYKFFFEVDTVQGFPANHKSKAEEATNFQEEASYHEHLNPAIVV